MKDSGGNPELSKTAEPDFALQTGQPPKKSVLTLLIICLILVYGMFIIRQFNGYDFARSDPGWLVTAVISIVEDRDLDLRNQLHSDPNEAADQTSLGKNGEWYPLHEFVMPIVTIPFYLVFGIFGCLIFNLVISILLMFLVFDLCARYVRYQIAFIATVLTAFTSLFLNYTYSYSQDVFSAFLLILVYWYLVKDRFIFAGLIWGIAVYARLANAITLPGYLLYIVLHSKYSQEGFKASKIKPVLSYLAGGVPAAVCFLFTNWLMFGSPVTTSYDRWQKFSNGQPIVIQQSNAFSCSMLEHLPEVLMDQKAGLVNGAPLIILAVAFGMKPFWRRARNDAVFLILTSVLLIALFSKYCNAVAGEPGNRYLMAVVAFWGIPLAFALEKYLHPVRDRSGSSKRG